MYGLGGGQGGCERRIEIFVKNLKKSCCFFVVFFGGGSVRSDGGSGWILTKG